MFDDIYRLEIENHHYNCGTQPYFSNLDSKNRYQLTKPTVTFHGLNSNKKIGTNQYQPNQQYTNCEGSSKKSTKSKITNNKRVNCSL